jgi:hypothetical protein
MFVSCCYILKSSKLLGGEGADATSEVSHNIRIHIFKKISSDLVMLKS